MARLRPALIGALILVLATLFGERPALVGSVGVAANPVEAVEPGEAPVQALLAVALQFQDDTDGDLTDPSGAGKRPAGRATSWRLESLHADVTPRRARPRSTGPPVLPTRA